MTIDIHSLLDTAKGISRKVALLEPQTKNEILQEYADTLRKKSELIITENQKDLEEAQKNGLEEKTDRLMLNAERINAIAGEIENVITLPDFAGEVISSSVQPSGIEVSQIRVPLGVVAMIYESRPNVTVDAAVLCLKSGNAVVLKGGKEAKYSNRILSEIFRDILKKYKLEDAVQLLDGATREDTKVLMQAKGRVDLLITRGGRGLIDAVIKNATVPVIETGASVVHTYIDYNADIDMAVDIVINEKTRRTSVCNALDTVLIHKDQKNTFMEKFLPRAKEYNLSLYADSQAFERAQKDGYINLFPATDETYQTEWLDYKLNLKVVEDIDEALTHIHTYSLGHSESIISQDTAHTQRFLNEVDSACVYHNTSTCFSDGAQFGLGAEIGISTQKLHARGPFALQALTTTKWIVTSQGETRI